jgi:hypothetical protein
MREIPMPTAINPETAIQDATVRVQDLSEPFIGASKQVAGEYLNATEKAAKSVVELQRQVAAQTDIDWVASIANAQARFTADISKVLISSGRELVK